MALALTVIIFAWFGFIIFDARRDVKMFEAEFLRIGQTRNEIVDLEEALTLSTYMAAATGDPKWEERFRSLNPQLVAAIKETTKRGTAYHHNNVTAKIDEANIKLVEMENKIFDLVRANRKEEALAIVTSPEYQSQKIKYREGVRWFNNEIMEIMTEREIEDKRIDVISMMGTFVAMAVIFAAGLTVMRGLQRRYAQLSDSYNRLTEARENLRRAHAELEVRVGERTADLAKSNEGLRAENNERKQAEAELGWKTAFLEAQVNSSPDGIIVVDQKGNKILQNQQVVDIFKIPPPIAKDKDDGQQILWVRNMINDPELFVEKISHLYSHPDEISKDEIELKDGRFLDRYSSPVIGKNGTHYGRIWSFRDITQRKQAEAALKAGELQYRSLIENMVEGYAHCQLLTGQDQVTDFIYLDVNAAYGRLTGLTNVVGRKISEIIPGFQEMNPGILETYGRVARTGKPESFEAYIKSLGMWLAISVYSYEKDHFTAVFGNITQQKLAEEELRESKRFAESIAENAASQIYIYDIINHKSIYTNRNAAESLGYSKAQIYEMGDNLLPTIIHPEDMPRVRQQLTRFAEVSDNRIYDVEYRVRDVDGQWRWLWARESVFKRSPDGAVWQIMGTAQDITERKEIEEALQQQQTKLQVLFDLLPAMIWFKDTKNRILRANKRAADASGKKVEEIEGRSTMEIYPELADKFYADDLEVIRSGTPKLGVIERIQNREGRGMWMQTDKVPFVDPSGSVAGIVVMAQDITDRVRLETQLIQSQKMDTVGKLAGGIAHEFNSILTAIIGQCELLLNDLPVESALSRNVCEISKAAGRAATLTRQLLAYSRKQMLKPEILDLNGILSGMGGMLSHVMGEAVDIRVVPAPGLASVRVDAGQMEQVIINMVINARDAMPNGGKLTLETMSVTIDSDMTARNPEMKPGDFVMLAITDTGTGMSEEVKAHIFEPFYSTKGAGEGTGLGLSTCYGIIKQSGGHINVYSEPGLGTSFKIYLPQVEALVKVPAPDPGPLALPHGNETILLVEDDPALREMATTLLQRLGYTVLAAANGIEALSLKKQRNTGHIDLLFTDVVMPHMSGKELADRMQSLYSHTRVLFTSAYTGHSIIHQGVLNKDVPMLQKPYAPSALAIKVREVLDKIPDTGSQAV